MKSHLSVVSAMSNSSVSSPYTRTSPVVRLTSRQTPMMALVPRSTPTQPDAPLGVVAQIRVAASRENRVATLVGALFGGFVPLAMFWITHFELPALSPHNWDFWTSIGLILGGLTFSALKVRRWAELALKSRAEALAFTVLMEGVMTLSHTPGFNIAALCYLIIINALATGVVLARDRQA